MIDRQASVHEQARIDDKVSVGPFSIIENDVEIGEGTVIGSHVVIKSGTRIGKYNHIYQFSSIGDAPQSVGYKGESTELIIGDHNIIREFTTLNRGTPGDLGYTWQGCEEIWAYNRIIYTFKHW